MLAYAPSKKFETGRAEPGEGLVRVPDEGAEHPRHLCADEAEDDHPDAEDGANMAAELVFAQRAWGAGQYLPQGRLHRSHL